jgi:hypothetical protein
MKDVQFKKVKMGHNSKTFTYPLTGFSLGLLFEISNWSIR